ncbi:MAG TPA: carboxymuconolactone decarboxylase family protein [Actinomycetota bacterium]|nr:carboxymuconolactone decarboxylase family protein [Actinomycetota bacterium]
MHLSVLESGQRRRARAAMWLAANVGRSPIDDVGKASLYRPELFGRSWLALVRAVLRGPSEWTAGERELFAAFVSRTNRCSYCTAVHSRMASLGLGHPIPVEAIDSWRSAGFDPKIMAVFGLLEAAALGPEAVGKEHIDAIRGEGVSDGAISDVLYLAFVFNLVNRLADALGFSWSSDEETIKGARVLDRIGYKMPRFLLR